jgi:NAD/NADP transhydrogenase beta subunit
MSGVALLAIFVLAVFVGFEVVSKVSTTLHTPLLSGIENDLLYDPKTSLLFGDAKDSLTKVLSSVKDLSSSSRGSFRVS